MENKNENLAWRKEKGSMWKRLIAQIRNKVFVFRAFVM